MQAIFRRAPDFLGGLIESPPYHSEEQPLVESQEDLMSGGWRQAR